MITKEAIEAALNAYYGSDVEHGRMAMAQMEAAITAALAAMPVPAVREQNEWLKTRLAEMQLPSTKRDHDTREKWLLHCGIPDASSLTPAPDLAAENERLRKALEKVVDWASRRCPADDESVPCPLCGARADIPGDFCKSVESIFPRDLLRDTRAALERT